MQTKVAYLSTSKLAAKHKKSVKEMFIILQENKLVKKRGRKMDIGGTLKMHFKAGEYIAWDVERIEEILIKVIENKNILKC